jgi:hypothetical protein
VAAVTIASSLHAFAEIIEHTEDFVRRIAA